MKTYKTILYVILILLVRTGLSTCLQQDSIKTNDHERNNSVNVNILPLKMTHIGYDRTLLGCFAIGLDWGHYYPYYAGAYYGLDNGDAQGIYIDLNSKYYKIGETEKFEGYIKFKVYDEDSRIGLFIRFSGNSFIVKNIYQVYFNSAVFNNRPGQEADSSITTFLNDSPNNKVYYREVKFNAWGWGVLFGFDWGIDKLSHFRLGLAFGGSNAFIPGYAKQPVFINGQEYYYEYTPAWESNINRYINGYITFTYTF